MAILTTLVTADKHKAAADGEHVRNRAPAVYNLKKIKQDDGMFRKVLAKHYKGRKHRWIKVVTNKSFTHLYNHDNEMAPTIRIRRLHNANEPLYTVKVHLPHPKNPSRNIYSRSIRTKLPSQTLDQMLMEARISKQENG